MKKSELQHWLQLGGEFTIDADRLRFSEILALAEAAACGRGKLNIRRAGRLYKEEISTLCRTAAGHISFPDLELDY